MSFVQVINFKMPTIVGILKFTTRTNITRTNNMLIWVGHEMFYNVGVWYLYWAQDNRLVFFEYVKKKSEENKLEDLKVLRRSPDLFNYVKIGQGQQQLIIKHILFYHIWELQPFWSSDLKQSNEYPWNSPVISEKQMFIVKKSGIG